MEALRAISLPPGFGFHPTDVELISHYLKKKILGLKIEAEVIPEIDIYKHEPWDLPGKCHVPTRDSKWHFFASRDKKYPNGSRSNRATEAGYWKSTGKDRNIKYQNRAIGTKKTLVFHEGRPPCGKRSDWIMHEYYINENECKAAPDMKDAFVLCRVTKRNGWGQDGENVSPLQSENVQPENVQSENVDDSSKQPKDASSSAAAEKSSSPSESAEDIDAWIDGVIEENVQFENVDDSSKQPKDASSTAAAEKSSSPSESADDMDAWIAGLIDFDFSPIPGPGEVKNEPEEGLSSLNPQEALSSLNPQFRSEFSEDSHLFPVEESYDILQSDPQSFDVFKELNLGNFKTFGDQQGDIFPALTNDGFSPNDEETWSGIQIRERDVAKLSSVTLNRRLKLQVNKMESRNNGESLRGTIKVNQDVHLVHTPYDEKQAAVEESKSLSVQKDFGTKTRRGFMRGLCGFFGRCSAASMNCFFLCACMMGTAALIFYFLLRDARRFIGSSSVLEL